VGERTSYEPGTSGIADAFLAAGILAGVGSLIALIAWGA